MNRKVFQAGNWFHKGTVALPNLSSDEDIVENRDSVKLPPFNTKNYDPNSALSGYFIPGWNGSALTSKYVQKFNAVLDSIRKDTKEKFLSLNNLNQKLKKAIHDEFFAFLEYKAITCSDLDDYNHFWNEIKNSEAEYREVLDQFIDIYSFRVTVIYTLKMRFIVSLYKSIGVPFELKNAFSPNSSITHLFQRGGQTELKAKSLESNIYSWYRPSDSQSYQISQLVDLSEKLHIAEIIKNLSLKSEALIDEVAEYSHTLSHKNFGLFLNSMLINFPLWLESVTPKINRSYFSNNSQMEIISCKYAGDYLESLSLSHWLAQENNQDIKWDQILCTDFKCNQFDKGHFLRYCHELHFLTFLTELASKQGKSVIRFVSQVMNSHLKNRKESNDAQKSLLMDDFEVNSSTYDRVIINLSHHPKNNVQHFLINQISSQESYLKDNGLIYVLSTKKLFVPSQKSKLEIFLKKFKLEAIINLEEVKGKGEIGNYLYILSKKNQATWPIDSEKQNCYSFRFSGELQSFQNFEEITSQMQQFFLNQLGELVPMYQKESRSGFRMEFFQDAIVDGRLIHSSSKDSSKITHPHFFNNLMRACHPFDFYFDVKNIHLDDEKYYDETSSFLVEKQSRSPYVLIVDQRNKNTVLEIIHEQSLEAKVYSHGRTQCSYFEIYPKWPNLNLNAVQDFFNTKIGGQIIDLTFNNELRKVKANLSKMLLPKFLIQEQHLPTHIAQGLKILSLSGDEITGLHPTQLNKSFQMIEMLASELSKNYPTAMFNSLSSFKKELKYCIDRFGIKNGNSINFANPMIKAPLLLSKTRPIYPNNPDVFIDFNNNSDASFLHKPLQRFRRIHNSENDVTSFGIELFCEDERIITLYSDEAMIQFLEFILAQTTQMPLAKILQAVNIPYLEDLKSIISSFHSLQEVLNQVHDRITPMIEGLINSVISSHKN